MARLTDDQIWILLHILEVSVEHLAAAFGVTVTAIHNVRWRLRRRGWTCSVQYRTCRHCGELLTIRNSHAKMAYHDACRPEARAAIQRVLDAQRPVTAEKLKRAHEWSRTVQAETKRQATQHMRRWSRDDDDILVKLLDHPITETCEVLGRSLHAVQNRRQVLKRQEGVIWSVKTDRTVLKESNQ
jgi:hypothetical protein